MSAPAQFCTLRIADLHLGLEVLSVQEVLRATHSLARVPLAPTVVEGLLNLRGQILTTIDLRRRFGLPPRPADIEPMWMIVRPADGPVALVVDSVGDVIELGSDSFEPPPETLPAGARGLVRGVHKLPGRLLHLLDVETATGLPAHAL